jgi:hypothetical protein
MLNELEFAAKCALEVLKKAVVVKPGWQPDWEDAVIRLEQALVNLENSHD